MDNELIKNLNEKIMNIKKSDKQSMDFYISDFLCLLDKYPKLKAFYNKQLIEYKTLQNNKDFKNSCEKLCNFIINACNDVDYKIYKGALTPFPELLYFLNIEYIYELITEKDQKKLVNCYGDSLFHRNAQLFKIFIIRKLRSIHKEEKRIDFKNMDLMLSSFSKVESFFSSKYLYDFHIFNLESMQSNIYLFEQIKIASVNILETFKEYIKSKSEEKTSTLKNERLETLILNILPEYDKLQPQQKNIFIDLYNGLTVYEISHKYNYLTKTKKPTSAVYTNAIAICNTLNLDKCGYKGLVEFINKKIKMQIIQ